MHVAAPWELAFHLGVLAWVTLSVTSASMRFSLSTVPVVVRAAGSSDLPTRLDRILNVPPAYLKQHHPHLLPWLPQRDAAPGAAEAALQRWAQRAPAPVAAAARGVLTVLRLPRDVSDVQWREFRAGLPLLAAGMAAYVLLSRLARAWLKGKGDGRSPPWVPACLLLSLAFLGVLHGAQAVWPLLLALLHYALSQACAGRPWGGPAIVWATHLALFVCIRATEGFAGLGSRISPQRLGWLDRHGGMLRWHIHHNFAMLRALSYFMDLHWRRLAARLPDSAAAPTAEQAAAPANGKPPGAAAEAGGGQQRQQASSAQPPITTFQTPALYMLYSLYPPLYIAGPIIPFGAWAAQALQQHQRGGRGKARSASPSAGAAGAPYVPPSAWQVGAYAARWLAALLVLELLTRTLHFNALAKHGLLTRGLLAAWGVRVQPLHFAVTGFWVLVFMWLKFLVIWRFFRLVALADGFEPPENMRRCVCNNFDVQGFWQGWHASYNRWLVRYLYVPLGGSAWRWSNVWVCFLFVALWHDLEWRMLAWGLLMPAAFLPELAVKALGRSRSVAPFAETAAYRHVAAALGAVNVVALMSANLVGFVVGPGGLAPLLREALGRGWLEAAGVLGTLWCAVQVMFALRQRSGEWRSPGMGGGTAAKHRD